VPHLNKLGSDTDGDFFRGLAVGARHQFQILRQVGQQAAQEVRFEQMAGRGGHAQHYASGRFLANAASAALVEY